MFLRNESLPSVDFLIIGAGQYIVSVIIAHSLQDRGFIQCHLCSCRQTERSMIVQSGIMHLLIGAVFIERIVCAARFLQVVII